MFALKVIGRLVFQVVLALVVTAIAAVTIKYFGGTPDTVGLAFGAGIGAAYVCPALRNDD